MHRLAVMGRNGMVASAHPLASMAGVDVLKRGGTAVDAAIATNAVLNVTQPHMCGVGGDLFLLIASAEAGNVAFLNASGRAPRGATRERVRALAGDQSADRVPFRSALAVTVPGCVDGWATAWQRFGRQPWSELFDAAIAYAEAGFPVSHDLCRWIAASQEILAQRAATRDLFLPGGRPPRAGALLIQADLARTLRAVAERGRDGFYTGQVAQQIAAAVAGEGGLLAADDLAAHRSDWRPPISTTYRGNTVFVTGDNTQGIASLIALNILEAYDLAGWGAADPRSIHHKVEAIKRAFADRDRYITDPAFSEIPWPRLLSKAYAAECRAEIESRLAAVGESGDPRGDTTAFSVVDREGNAVSAIQSIYAGFGSGLLAPGTGVLLQNRGASFSLDPAHVNRLEPGKRPFHTLMATMVLRDGKPVLSFSTMGADGQPQTTVQVLTNILDHGMNVQEAIEQPRWLQGRMFVYETETSLQLEGRFAAETVAALSDLGHQTRPMPDWAYQMGHAQGIAIDPATGVLMGGADPRGDGYVIGW